MGSPSAQKDDNTTGIEIDFIGLQIPYLNKEEKKLGIIVEGNGSKDDFEMKVKNSLEKLMEVKTKTHKCMYDKETNTMKRELTDGKEIAVGDKNSFKRAYKEMKEKGKIYLENNKETGYDLEEK